MLSLCIKFLRGFSSNTVILYIAQSLSGSTMKPFLFSGSYINSHHKILYSNTEIR